MAIKSTIVVIITAFLAMKEAMGYPPLFQDLANLNAKYEVNDDYYDSGPKSFKQHVIENSKGTLIMKADEWKLEWCKAKSFNQTIRHPGCLPRIIQNNYCYGQCNSIYIPGERRLEGCNSCMPKSYEMAAITLLCPFSKQKRHHKQIQLIYSCYCYNCPKPVWPSHLYKSAASSPGQRT